MTSDLVDLTRQGAAFDSREEAERAIAATLETLGECISTGEARDIAAFLPDRYEEAILPPESAPSEPHELETFLDRVAVRLDVSQEEAERRVRAVMAALARTVGEPELSDARSQLPPEYGRIFETGGGLVGRPFPGAVADATDLDEAEATTAARATLETLGDRLTRGEAEDLAHYLRDDAAVWIVSEESDAEALTTDEFVQRVARRADVDQERAQEYVEATIHTLAGIVPDEELERATAQLPDAYAGLLPLPASE